MLRRLSTPMAAVLLTGGLLFPSLRAAENLHPFTHLATIPAGADLSTIRFEKVRLVQLPSRIKYTSDEGYCKELAFRDPGGSMACPSARTEAPVSAYEVTYSFTGQPLGSDETGGRNFTLSVYFRPNELPPDVQKALSERKLSRSDAAAYFAVSTSREPAKRVVIDDRQSHFCAGNYVDGAWAHTDAGCLDTINYTSVTAPSDYITVKVDAASSRMQQAGMVAKK